MALGQWLLEQGQDDLALSELLRAQATGIVDGRFTLALAAVQARSGAYVDAAGNAALVEKKSAIDLKVRAGAALLAGSQVPQAVCAEVARFVPDLDAAVSLVFGPDVWLR